MLLGLLADRALAVVDHGTQAILEAEVAVLLPDEVDDRERGLVVAQPQTAPQLLSEYGGRLRGPQEQDRVDVGDVDAFAQHVDAEDAAQRPAAEALEKLAPLILRRDRADGAAGHPERVESLGHEARVLDRDAKPQRPHAVGVGVVAVQRVEYAARTGVIAGEEPIERARVVAAAP